MERRKIYRRWWIRPNNLDRDNAGYFVTVFTLLKDSDPDEFFKQTRMERQSYDSLIELIKDQLVKHSLRPPIDFEIRLAVTLS